MDTINPDLYRDIAVRVQQEEDFAIWVAGDDAVRLIGGEVRNHVDTAHAAWLDGWAAACRFALKRTT